MTQYEFELNNTLPNQSFTTTINNIDMEVVLKLGGDDDLMYFALLSGEEYICPYVPCFANQYILPYEYMEVQTGGNFIFITENDEYPNYQNFGTTCKLYFVTSDELN